MSLRLKSVVLVLFIFLLPSLTYASPSEKADLVQHTILIMGDSISAGYGIDKTKGWVALLEKKLKANVLGEFRIANASISGETSTGGNTRLGAQLKKHSPNLVIIELGANDALRGTPIKHMTRNLESMITASIKSGADVMLLGMRIPPNYGERYTEQFASAYVQLAKKHELLLVPFLLDGVAGLDGMMQTDGIHPTELGQPVMESLVWEKMKMWLDRH